MSKKTTPNNLEIMRHSAAHVLAAAVLEMFPEAKFAIGPAIENGFYYDFDLPRTLIPEDLPILEEKMKAIIKANYPFERAEISISEALKDFEKARQDYKVELVKDLEKEEETKVSIYKTGNFVDLCRGPHLDSTGEIPADAIKLTKISGAYWKGDEKNKMLQRIYGVAFESKEKLDEYLHMISEAEKRNHVKLGKELKLFSTHAEGPGFPFFHPNGMIIWNELISYWKEEHTREGYQEISTPIILNRARWEKSGHWDHYKENMYFTKIDDADYAVKLDLVDVPTVTVDNEKGAYQAARTLVMAAGDGPKEAAILEGIRSAANAEARRQGAVRAFNEAPDITVVASESANWQE
jgi:threonyl-tRNA synthetase